MVKYPFRFSICFARLAPVIFTTTILFCMTSTAHAQKQEMIIRISEIEVYQQYLAEYKTILTHEASASVNLEDGVIAIFPMFRKENPEQIRILEMYKNQDAYQSHLKTEHFLKYKTSTLSMVKSLRLVDMEAMDLKAAAAIFRKSEDGTVK